jgi:hypothetical protein
MDKQAKNAIAETEAQLQILRVMAAVGSKARAQRILNAAGYLLEAEQCVPGILDQFLKGGKE